MPSIIPLAGLSVGERPILVEMYMCFKCGKIDLYGPDETDENSQLKIVYGVVPKGSLIKCTKCGKPIVAGSKKCPFCGDEQPYSI